MLNLSNPIELIIDFKDENKNHFVFSNLKVFSEENIIEEILSATIAECVDETNVDRNSLLIDTSFYLLVVMRNLPQHGRPAIIFSLRYSLKQNKSLSLFDFFFRTSLTSDELQQRYDLQTHREAFETSELKFWPLNKLLELLNPSQSPISITPSCHVALTTYHRLFF